MHIVVFTGGIAPDPKNVVTYFTNTPEPSPVIAADSGLDTLRRFQESFKSRIDFSPDYIVGDMDSISNVSLITQYPQAQVKKFPRDKYSTDTEIALETAMQLKKSDDDFITLVGGAGGRIDHLIGIYDTFSTTNHADVWLYDMQILYYAPLNCTLRIAHVSQTDAISVAHTSESRVGGRVETHGLEWGGDVFRKEGMPSISNRIATEQFQGRDTTVTLTVKEGTFLVIVPCSAVVTVTNRQKGK